MNDEATKADRARFARIIDVGDAMTLLDAIGCGGDPVMYVEHPDPPNAASAHASRDTPCDAGSYYGHTDDAADVPLRYYAKGDPHERTGTLATLVLDRIADDVGSGRHRAALLVRAWGYLDEGRDGDDTAATVAHHLGVTDRTARGAIRTLCTLKLAKGRPELAHREVPTGRTVYRRTA